MKNLGNLFLAMAFIAATFSFTGPIDKKSTTYKADLKKSTVKWTGTKVTGAHTGNIAISNGNLVWEGQSLKGGNFDIDMNSITCTDLSDAEYNKKLIDHLKNEDFFSTTKYPKTTFVISKVAPKSGNNYDVTGKLTIKNITQEIVFPATITTSGNTLNAVGKMVIDRTKFDIKYGSGSFFDNLGDKAIEDNFTLDINLVANK